MKGDVTTPNASPPEEGDEGFVNGPDREKPGLSSAPSLGSPDSRGLEKSPIPGLTDSGQGQDSLSTIDPDGPQVTIDVQIEVKNAEDRRREEAELGSDGEGFRGRTCTPASFFSDFTELKSCDQFGRSRNPLYGDSRDAMFQQAINLMSERCPSMNQGGRPIAHSAATRVKTPLLSNKTTPVGTITTKYFYVEQKKPSPMSPLKAWRGYNGNVYFEPITVGQAPASSEPEIPREPSPENCSPTLRQILQSRNRSRRRPRDRSAPARTQSATEPTADSANGDVPPSSPTTNRSKTAMELRQTSPSRGSAHYYRGPRQMSILDKNSILNRENDRIREDVGWVLNQESTGSLCIRATGPTYGGIRTSHLKEDDEDKHRKKQEEKEKICRGSVAHKIYAMKNKRIPLLSVTGDKFQQQVLPSPLMRAQTQYSQSSQRISMNSPDPYHMSMLQGYDRLPPLEQLRASLKQMEHSGNADPAMFAMSAMERLKFEDVNDSLKKQPFVKYSQEVRNSAKQSRQMSHRVK